MGSKAENLKLLFNKGFNVPKLYELTDVKLTEKLLEEIVNKQFPNIEYFAVRSSADVEDGSEKSYAGHFHSEIGISPDKIYEAYIKVLSSLNEHKGKVFIQEFIPSDKSGVLFTNDGKGLMIINSCQGICKNVVEGNACDEWFVSNNGTLLKKFIGYKRPLIFDNGNIIISSETKEKSLNQDEISKLIETGKKIENFFSKPQDIEWCFYQGKLFILQSRPITRSISQHEFVFYDSANIAESYSGIVLPLTHSFAVSIYKKVYENLLMASGVSSKRIARNQDIFSNMVSNFYGRMYYNMNNWYRMMSFLPGYNRNKGNLENMLTMNIKEDVPARALPSLWLKIGYPFIVIYKLIVFNSVIRRFKEKVKSTLQYYRNEKIEEYSTDQCLKLYDNLSKELLEEFHIPVENDFLLMTYLGILRRKYNEDELKKIISFESISSRQVEALSDLAKLLFSIPGLAKSIESLDADNFNKILPDFKEAQSKVKHYFEVYGSRFANELKLESENIENEKELFLKLIKAYKDYEPIQLNRQQSLNAKGFIFRKFFKYAKQREELRLLRSNCFSLVRRIFSRMGILLENSGKIKAAHDIFYLTLEELRNVSVNDSPELGKTILCRKSEYLKYEKISPPAFFYVHEGELPDIDENKVTLLNELKGRPCNPGIISGKVRVFEEFTFPESIDFDIIVTRNTDPGWNALIGLAKGLILENGGILSHAAIVSRELGIPAVIGAEQATKLLKTGQMVEINGYTGIIKILEE